jgi:hypothetical protein
VTIEELRERCKVWQQRLRLQDWEIHVQYVRKTDADGWWGELSTRHINHRYARVSIVEPGSFIPEDWPREKTDPEHILVHELLHIYTEGILGEPPEGHEVNRDGVCNHWAEQMADAVAQALVGRDRPSEV